jgi:hypothetical protein
MSIRLILILSMLVGCGGDDDGGGVDAPNVPAMIMISGTATSVGLSGSTPEEGVLVEAFENSNDTSPVANTMTDAQGNYTLVITTNGQPLDGFVKATKTGLVDTYLYPPRELIADFAGASLNMVPPGIFDFLSTACGGNQDPTKGTIAVLVVDAANTDVAGAMVSSSPAASKVCYNGADGLPSNAATVTAADGIGYLFNVTGNVTVSAEATGATFASHAVTARAAALTTTLITP